MISILEWLVLSIECVVTIVPHLAGHLPALVICDINFKISRTRLLAVDGEINRLSCFVPLLNSLPVDLDFAWICWVIYRHPEGTAGHCHASVVDPYHLLLCLPWCVGASENSRRFLLQKRSLHFKVLVAELSLRLSC